MFLEQFGSHWDVYSQVQNYLDSDTDFIILLLYTISVYWVLKRIEIKEFVIKVKIFGFN